MVRYWKRWNDMIERSSAEGTSDVVEWYPELKMLDSR
jgi:hypothetical protein